jgi:hypothetical protein
MLNSVKLSFALVNRKNTAEKGIVSRQYPRADNAAFFNQSK